MDTNQLPSAEIQARRLYQLRKEFSGEADQTTIASLNAIGEILRLREKHGRAAAIYRELIELMSNRELSRNRCSDPIFRVAL